MLGVPYQPPPAAAAAAAIIHNHESSKCPPVVLLLGCGWVATRFVKMAASREYTVITTCRTIEKCKALQKDFQLAKISEDSVKVLEFDLNRRETWKNLPSNISNIYQVYYLGIRTITFQWS